MEDNLRVGEMVLLYFHDRLNLSKLDPLFETPLLWVCVKRVQSTIGPFKKTHCSHDAHFSYHDL